MKALQLMLMAIAVLAIAARSIERATAQAPNTFPQPDPQSAGGGMQVLDQINELAVGDAEMASDYAKDAADSARLRMGNFFGNKRNHELDAQIRQTSAQVRDAKDDATRAAATAELAKLMDQYFEADVRVREQELADIAARLGKLQAQLDRRREKKSEIIELQVKLAINEADGLGFYSQPKDDGMFNFRVPVPVTIPSAGAVWVPTPAEIPLEPPAPVSADGKPSATEIPQ